ncbi:recombinase family protein [Salinibacterium sp. G-O1]|uniref:recombinase family protein n=1 Tax=Salinibacterium sp. G-O1 TaxID=3046208 RepID=UPI0024B9D7CD|nr:recombinase family protein [Salinibacterium sp. G-O1]MDJ0334268.1 recombinase family protein [Salinibacterium sp. G-O1]
MSTKNPAPLRAAIYARQSVAEPLGIDRQIEACTALAASRDYPVVERYVDDNVSGYKARGEGTAFDRMLGDARAGKFDVLIVRKLDRLGRSLSALEALTAAKVATVTTDGEVDLASPSGRLIANVLTAVARNESEVKAERRVFANSDRRTKGVPTSGRVPYGYRWVSTKERAERGTVQAYELDEERAADVRLMFEQFLAGVPLGSIARDLNERGRRTLPYKNHPEGVPFRPTTVRRILLSPYYAALLPTPPEGGWGTYDQETITRDQCVEGAWEAIVGEETWLAAKEVLGNGGRRDNGGKVARKWLLSGLAVCGVCYEPVRAGGGEAGIHSYRCRSMAHFMRRGDPLDRFVESVIVERLSRPDAVELLLDKDRPDADALRAERLALSARLDSVVELVADGTLTTENARASIRSLREKLAAIDSQMTEAGRVDVLGDIVDAVDVAALWEGLSLARKRAVLETLMTVVVHTVGQGGRSQTMERMASTTDILWKE